MTKDDAYDTLARCNISSLYDGFDVFRQFAEQEPDSALHIAWSFLTSRGDPGRDDGQLCAMILELLNELCGREKVEDLIRLNWSSMNDSVRRNFVSAASSEGAISTKLALELFNLPETHTEQRHLIVAGLAARNTRPGIENLVVDMAKQIGSYSEPQRQQSLEAFVQNVIQNFG